MAKARPRRPDLMTVDQPPRLIGHVCGACGRQAFPPDPYGCERCGAPAKELVRCELEARGTIQAVAVVHRHHRPVPPTPFTVATIVLGDGIALKAVLDEGEAEPGTDPPAVGSVVRGVPVSAGTDDEGVELLDLRFEVVPDEPEVE
ncbi:MAG: Zn-ribbon domain-containing OB-fold protein [Acidimicrobiales bacterium]